MCEYTPESYRNDVFNSVRQFFPNAKILSYTDGTYDFYVNYNDNFTESNHNLGKFKNAVNELNTLWQKEKYGEQFFFEEKSDGLNIHFVPNNQYITDVNIRREEKEILNWRKKQSDTMGFTREELDSYENTEFHSQVNMNTQASDKENADNFLEYVEYLSNVKNKIKSKINYLNVKLKNSKEENSQDWKKLIKLQNQLSIVNSQEERLKQDPVKYIYGVMDEELGEILDYLEDTENTEDAYDIKEKIDFYEKFFTNLSVSEGIDYSDLHHKFFNIKRIYAESNKNKIIQIIKNDPAIQETLKSVNEKDSSTGTSYAERTLGREAVLEDLLDVGKDVDLFISQLVDIKYSRGGDGIIPQLIRRIFRNNVLMSREKVQGLIDRLNKLSEQYPQIGRSWLFQTFEDGSRTGNLIDKYTTKWYDAHREFMELGDKMKSANRGSKTNKRNIFMQNIRWIRKNAVVLNIYKIPEIYAIYGSGPYAERFKYSEKEMEEYSEELKRTLGLKYDSFVKSLMSELRGHDERSLNIQGKYAERYLAEDNLWDFIYKFHNKDYTPNEYILSSRNTQGSVYFSNFEALPIVPKKESTTVHKTPDGEEFHEVAETGFYDPKFDEVEKDSVKAEFWKLFAEMSETINSIYNYQNQGLSYPKIEEAYIDGLVKSWKMFKKGKILKGAYNAAMITAGEFKSWYYEKGSNKNDKNIIKNYSDSSKAQIKELTKIYIKKGYTEKEAHQKATSEIVSTYSDDIDTLFKAVLAEAAIHDARVKSEPIIQVLRDDFVNKSSDNEGSIDRKKSVERLDAWINKVVYNNIEKERGKGNIESKDLSKESLIGEFIEKLANFINGKTSKNGWLNKLGNKISNFPKLYTKAEKILLEEYRNMSEKGVDPSVNIHINEKVGDKLFQFSQTIVKGSTVYVIGENTVSKEDFEKMYQQYLDARINSLGLETSFTGIIDGILKTIIFKGLALAPISGFFNRIEGMHNIMIKDLTGEFWTVGNADIAKMELAFANAITLSPDKIVDKVAKRKVDNVKILVDFLSRYDILQDRKNELQKNTSDSKYSLRKLNLYKWAVELPEFKNQSTVALSVMMDSTILDDEGNEHKFFNSETEEFSALKYENGNIVLREGFKNFKFDSNENLDMTEKISHAISATQGEYDTYSNIMFKNRYYGRAIMLFKTWLPMQIISRLGSNNPGELNANIVTKGEMHEGYFVRAYKASPTSFMLYVLSGLGISFGLFGLMSTAGLGIISAIAFKFFLKDVKTKVPSAATAALDTATFLKSTIIETLGYPIRVSSSLWSSNETLKRMALKLNNSSFSRNSKMTEKDKGAIRALSRDLAIQLSFLLVKLMIAALDYDDDDDEKSPKRMRYNFYQNQLSKSINALTIYSQPTNLINEVSNLAILRTLNDAHDLLYLLIADWDEEDHNTKLGKVFMKNLPIPSTISKLGSGQMIWEDATNYDTKSTMKYTPATMKWVHKFAKNHSTEGQYTAGSNYTKFRKKLRNEIKDNYMDVSGGDKRILKIISDQILKDNLGQRKTGQTPGDFLKQIEGKEVNTETANPKSKGRTKKKLKKIGVSEDTIEDILDQMYD